MTCPHCFSPNITLIQYDFGMDQSTGVRDKGEIFECRACSRLSTPEEVELEDIRSFDQAMKGGCVLALAQDLINLQLELNLDLAASKRCRGGVQNWKSSLILERSQSEVTHFKEYERC